MFEGLQGPLIPSPLTFSYNYSGIISNIILQSIVYYKKVSFKCHILWSLKLPYLTHFSLEHCDCFNCVYSSFVNN